LTPSATSYAAVVDLFCARPSDAEECDSVVSNCVRANLRSLEGLAKVGHRSRDSDAPFVPFNLQQNNVIVIKDGQW
jgi:hypothetical protein